MKNTKIFFQAALLACFAFLFCASQTFAHRINIFALVESDQIRVECKFSKKSPAQNSPVTVFDKATNKQLAQKNTDEEGVALFPITPEMKAAPQGLRVPMKTTSSSTSPNSTLPAPPQSPLLRPQPPLRLPKPRLRKRLLPPRRRLPLLP